MIWYCSASKHFISQEVLCDYKINLEKPCQSKQALKGEDIQNFWEGGGRDPYMGDLAFYEGLENSFETMVLIETFHKNIGKRSIKCDKTLGIEVI